MKEYLKRFICHIKDNCYETFIGDSFPYKKEKLILWGKTVALMIKVELENNLKGADKFEKVMNLIKAQSWYNKSILKYIPEFILKTLVQTIFNKNKQEIEEIK